MVLKPTDNSIIPAGADKIWEDDILHRQGTADLFIDIISSRREAITMCLNSGWGTGKTFFLSRLCEQYRRHKVNGIGGRAIYFNAWEDDNLSDPLVAIVGQLWKNLKGGTCDESAKTIIQCVPKIINRTAFNAMLGLLKSVPVVGKAIEEFTNDLAPEALETASERVFGNYCQLTEDKADLRNRLGELGTKIMAETDRPLLFVIDELDRCRPTFAIETLERVKHLFGVPNIVFLFGVDCAQLKQSIRAVYGHVDADNYLNRFFDVEMSLPEANQEQFLWMLHGRHEVENTYGEYFLSLMRTLQPLAQLHALSLRELEKAERTIALIIESNLTSNAECVVMLPVMLILKMRRKEIYDNLLIGNYQYAELIDALYGEAQEHALFMQCRRGIDYITQWQIENFQHDEKRTALHDKLDAISKSTSLNGIDMTGLPKLFEKISFGDLQSCAKSTLTAHGWNHAEEAIPIIAAALNCIQH